MRNRSTSRQRRAPRLDDAGRRRPVESRFDLSSITFTEEEILADLVYPGRAPGRAPRGR